MAANIRKGTLVEWRWASGTAEGKVIGVHPKRVELTIKGSHITRDGSDDNPALEIEQENGSRVLKLRSEVSPA